MALRELRTGVQSILSSTGLFFPFKPFYFAFDQLLMLFYFCA